MSEYLYDQSWEQERARLGALESLFDGASRARLADLGVGPGWRCLDVGAGGGSIARWLASRVAPDGRVLATDLDPRFVAAEPPVLEVRRHNLLADDLPPASFDLVHARAVLEHLPAREEALARMIAATRPGGWVVVEDFDVSPATRPMARHLFHPQSEVDLFDRVTDGLDGLFRSIGADMEFAGRLPTMLTAAGLVDVGAALFVPVVAGGPGTFMELSLDFLGPRLVSGGLLTEDEIARMRTVLRSTGSFHASMALVSAWGRRSA